MLLKPKISLGFLEVNIMFYHQYTTEYFHSDLAMSPYCSKNRQIIHSLS